MPVESNVEFHVFQVNQGFSKKAGTLRGLHFQEGEHAQAKLVSCLHGSIFNVAVDLRPGDTYTSIQLSLSKVMRFYNKKCSISNKNALFPTPSPKITSGEISAKEAAEERIWAGRTPPAPDAPRNARDIHMKNRIMSSTPFLLRVSAEGRVFFVYPCLLFGLLHDTIKQKPPNIL